MHRLRAGYEHASNPNDINRTMTHIQHGRLTDITNAVNMIMIVMRANWI